MALILLLESSTEVCSAALSLNGELIDLKESTEGMNHSELLTVFVEELLLQNRLRAKDLDAIATCKGPGSYTGLRIGVSAAKGICYAVDKPLIAISTLDAMSDYVAKYPEQFNITITESTYLCPMLDARRMEAYSAVYNSKGEMISPINAAIIEEHSFTEFLKQGEMIFFGNGAYKSQKVITSPNALFSGPAKASARFMVHLAEDFYNKKTFEDVAYFEPYYLKDFVATVPKNKLLWQKK